MTGDMSSQSSHRASTRDIIAFLQLHSYKAIHVCVEGKLVPIEDVHYGEHEKSIVIELVPREEWP